MKNKIFTIIVLFAFFIIFLFINPVYTGYTIDNQTDSNQTIIQGYKDIADEAELIATELENKFLLYTDQQKEISSYFGHDIDSILGQISDHQLEIQDILNSTDTNKEKASELEIIKQSLEEIQQIPEIQIKKTIKNLPIPRATEIQDIYLLEDQRFSYIKQQVLISQSNINIKTDLIHFGLITNDTAEEKTLVKKTIDGTLTDIYLIEEITKIIADSIDEIKFITDNYEIIESDPIVRWSVSSLPVTIIYIVPENIIDYYKELITTAIPKTISYEPSEEYKKVICGDGICTTPLEDKITCPEDCMKKVNWWFVIILLALLIGGIYYLNFYRGKLSFKKTTTEKPSLFKSKADEINLRNYVKKSLDHKIPKSRIRTILLAKGWNEKQIDHIFRTL